jgi:periplasmic protein CpxP/Spy
MRMNKVKLITYFSVGLLLLNLILIWQLLSHKSRHNDGGARQKIIAEKLGFNEEQNKKYKILIEQHRAEMSVNRSQMMQLRNDLNATLSGGSNNKDSLITLIGQMQVAIEQTNYKHFEAIKSICTPEQLASFDELTKELAHIFTPIKPHHEKPHEKH